MFLTGKGVSEAEGREDKRETKGKIGTTAFVQRQDWLPVAKPDSRYRSAIGTHWRKEGRVAAGRGEKRGTEVKNGADRADLGRNCASALSHQRLPVARPACGYRSPIGTH